MTIDETNIASRLAVLEVRQSGLDADLHEVRNDIREIKAALQASQAGLTRPEKIALAASASAVVGALLGVIALLSGGPS